MPVRTLSPTFQSVIEMKLTKQTYPSNIYVRQCYSQIADTIVEKFKTRQDNRVVYQVGGTPQIGKSQFANYLMNRIIRESDNVYEAFIVLSYRKTRNDRQIIDCKYYCCLLDFERGKCTQGETEEVFGVMRNLGYVDDEDIAALGEEYRTNGIMLLDGFQGIPGNFDSYGHSIVFASPSFLNSQDSSTPFPGTCIYMPLWTKQEMDEYKSLISPTDPFNGKEVAYLYRLYSGCIGFCTSTDQNLMKEFYQRAVKDHCEKYAQNSIAALDPTSVAQAKMIALIPYNNGNQARKEWLTEALKQQVEFTWTVNHVYERHTSVQNRRASNIQVGLWFEDFVASSWLINDKIVVDVYENKENELGKETIKESFEWIFKSPPLIVEYTTNNFGVAFNTLYRLSVGAPSVDFYYLEPNKDRVNRNYKYRLYLLQVTTAVQHSVDAAEVLKYLKKIWCRIDENDTIRTEIASLVAARNHVAAEQKRQQYSFAAVDGGKEPTVNLDDPGVEIWFLYLQDKVNTEFKGKIVYWSDVGTSSTESAIWQPIRQKVKTLYSVGTIRR